MPVSVRELASVIGAPMPERPDATVARVTAIDRASSDSVVFAESEATFARAARSGAGAIIAAPWPARPASTSPVLLVDEPRLAFARVARLLAASAPVADGIHPTAEVSRSARLGEGVSVGAHAVVADDVTIGRGTRLGPGVVIGRGVRIGEDCDLVAHVVLYGGTVLGSRVIVHAGAVLGSDGFGFVRDPVTRQYEKFPQIGTLEIGDDVEIGANTTIDRGALGATAIGAGTKIDNLVQVAHNVRIGSNVIIAAQSGIAGSTLIGDDVILAGQVGVADHVRIEDGVIVGAKAGVPSGKVLRGRGRTYWGNPARPLPEVMRQLAGLARLARRHRDDRSDGGTA